LRGMLGCLLPRKRIALGCAFWEMFLCRIFCQRILSRKPGKCACLPVGQLSVVTMGYGSTRLGNDTDSIAAIAGSLAGALRGFDALPQDTYATFAEANRAEHDIEQIADGLVRIALRNLS